MSIRLEVFSDYIWPFCFIGEGIVEKLRQEFDLAVEWKGIEIHPETPAGGRPLSELFREEDVKRMTGHLQTAGAPFGITFVDRSFLSNSKKALQAAEFARDHGKFGAFHPALFSAYFSRGLDIGNSEVLARIAAESGLDPDAMSKSLQEGTYLPKLEAAKEEAALLNVTGVPAFFINRKRSVVGAQPLDVFRKALRSAS
jgi:predicted DsbA family dithiol-disulfide isomerase